MRATQNALDYMALGPEVPPPTLPLQPPAFRLDPSPGPEPHHYTPVHTHTHTHSRPGGLRVCSRPHSLEGDMMSKMLDEETAFLSSSPSSVTA